MNILIKLNEEFVKKQFYARKVPSELLEETLSAMEGISVLGKEAFSLVIRLEKEELLEQAGETAVQALVREYEISPEAAAKMMDFSQIPDAPDREDEQAATVMDEIRKIHGAEEFISLCEEIHGVAPRLLRRQASQVFISRSYLISCESCEVLSLSLNLFSRFLKEEGLFEAVRVVERKVPLSAAMQQSMGPGAAQNILGQNQTEDVLEAFSSALALASNIIVSLDISEWIDRIDAPEFRDFLESLQDNTENVIYVFRVPYLTRITLEMIETVLCDIMHIRTLTFVPHNVCQLQEMVEDELADLGYRLDEEAGRMFRQRITEEKADGHFSGILTADKILDEIVYMKMCYEARTGEESEVISPVHLEGLVRSRSWDKDADQIIAGLTGFEEPVSQLREAVEDIVKRRAKKGNASVPMHMCFTGDVGTGRSTAARLAAVMLREKGLLSDGLLFEHRSRDFVIPHLGRTVPNTMNLCRNAVGNVLLVDELEDFFPETRAGGEKPRPDRNGLEGDTDYAGQAMSVLLTLMDDHRQDLAVILAGSAKDITKLRELYPDLKQLMPYEITFTDFSRENMGEILLTIADKQGMKTGKGMKEAVREYFSGLDESILRDRTFSNARFVQNLLERTRSRAILRMQMNGQDVKEPPTLERSDFLYAARSGSVTLNRKDRTGSKYGFGI